MDRKKFEGLRLGDGELFVHDDSDIADYDQFFEFFLSNGEMNGRVDALHSQHLRDGAKKDVLGIRLVDLWGERTYPIHRSRPGGRFISKLIGPSGAEVGVNDLSGYSQTVDKKTGILSTAYDWTKGAAAGAAAGRNASTGFMSKVRKHLMVHRYLDFTASEGWTRTFTVETIFPYHSRASAFYFKRPYGGKEWAWGEQEHNYEIEPSPNATVGYDDEADIGLVTFATEFEPLATRVVWCVRPAASPDRWVTDETTGALTLEWDLVPGVDHDTTIFISIMTDRDTPDFMRVCQDEAGRAHASGWESSAAEHSGWWETELAKSNITIPDPQLMQLYDIAMLYMLGNVGGSYLPFLGIDNVIYETCMCDNPVMLHSLLETNHLEAARQELELIHERLPGAKQNARDRMRVVLGIENDDAALIPFYMAEDGVELWQDNVLGMYTSPAAYHTALLTKSAAYLDDEQFLRTIAYPWLRAYAEYGRLNAVWNDELSAFLFPIENLGGGGEGYWYRQTMSNRLYWRIFAHLDPMFRFADFPRIEWFPLEEIRALEGNWLDVVVNFRWILTCAAKTAEALGLDDELRSRWTHVAENTLLPQDDNHYLQHLGESADPYLGGPAVGSVFWPAEGTFEDLHPEKLSRTLSAITSELHLQGLLKRGGRAWDAINGLAYAYTGNGETALEFLQSFGYAADRRGIEMRESIPRQNYYYLLNQGTLILLLRNMLIQTFNRTIRVFPAVPNEWRQQGLSFSGMPAECGLMVDGRIDPGPKGGDHHSTVTIRRRSGEAIVTLSGGFASLHISLGANTHLPDVLEMQIAQADTEIVVTAPKSRGTSHRLGLADGTEVVLGPGQSVAVAAQARVSVRKE